MNLFSSLEISFVGSYVTMIGKIAAGENLQGSKILLDSVLKHY